MSHGYAYTSKWYARKKVTIKDLIKQYGIEIKVYCSGNGCCVGSLHGRCDGTNKCNSCECYKKLRRFFRRIDVK